VLADILAIAGQEPLVYLVTAEHQEVSGLQVPLAIQGTAELLAIAVILA
jgi:hypothetical protein